MLFSAVARSAQLPAVRAQQRGWRRRSADSRRSVRQMRRPVAPGRRHPAVGREVGYWRRRQEGARPPDAPSSVGPRDSVLGQHPQDGALDGLAALRTAVPRGRMRTGRPCSAAEEPPGRGQRRPGGVLVEHHRVDVRTAGPRQGCCRAARRRA